MRVLVLGAGATGGYFGSRLIESGNQVDFLVRPARAAILERNGLRVHAVRRPFAAPVRAITSIAKGVNYDLVLLSCKAYDLDSAIVAIRPALTGTSWVLPLLNGLRHLQALDTAFGHDHVLGGLCHISVALDGDGSIRQVGAIDRLTFGVRDTAGVLPEHVRSALLAMPVEVRQSDDILAAMWRKFAFLAALAGITCLLRANIGAIVATPDGAALARRLYLECAETAARSGYAQDAAASSEALGILNAPDSPLKASMLRDLERGAQTEVEHVLGDLLARARSFDVDAPLLTAACALLRAHEASRAATS